MAAFAKAEGLIWWKADVALRSLGKQHSRMANISDGWWNEDRRDLFSSIEVIASERPDPDRIGLCLDTILNDLELYDDPRQGAGAWLFDDELELAERLGENLHGATGETRPVEAGPTAIASAEWPGARATAIELIRRMETNGDFSR